MSKKHFFGRRNIDQRKRKLICSRFCEHSSVNVVVVTALCPLLPPVLSPCYSQNGVPRLGAPLLKPFRGPWFLPQSSPKSLRGFKRPCTASLSLQLHLGPFFPCEHDGCDEVSSHTPSLSRVPAHSHSPFTSWCRRHLSEMFVHPHPSPLP